MACLKRLYEGIAGSPVVPFSFSGANTGMNNQEGRLPPGTGQGGSARSLPSPSFLLFPFTLISEVSEVEDMYLSSPLFARFSASSCPSNSLSVFADTG
ncbi:hypothetical protein ACVHL3_003499 [Escherichia coli]